MDVVSLPKRFDRPTHVLPILVVGEPGIGKSYFTDQLLSTLGVLLTRIVVDNLQIGTDIAGMSLSYSGHL